MNAFVGTAGWSLPKASAGRFAGEGSHLVRYASRLNAVEINSSFYKPHRTATYQRWNAATPDGFRFAVKVPRTITHEQRLENARELIQSFAVEVAGLGDKLGVLLVQLPPSLAFDEAAANRFFEEFAAEVPVPLVCEPRHRSWFTPRAEALLIRHRVPRVAADPAVCESAAVPGGWQGLSYFRWHGWPRTYYSNYDDGAIAALAERVLSAGESREVWCIFDNTALGAATENALELRQSLTAAPRPPLTCR